MRPISALAFFILLALPARALTWNESIDGDLSGNENAPTPLTFNLGSNFISGQMGTDLPTTPDRDIFTFTLAPGQALTSIVFTFLSPPAQSFYAIAAGTSINISSSANHLSNTLVRNTGTNILTDLATSSFSPSLGLTAPLGAGTYTIWFQELSSVITYESTYTVVPVPEPSLPMAIGIFGLLLAITRARRRQRS